MKPRQQGPKDWYRNRYIRDKYGLDERDVIALFTKQCGDCALCGDELGPGQSRAIDHCHETGVVRGLLCRECNVGIGMLRHNKQLLLKAAQYVGERNHNDKQ
jgi:hypothetical protein